MCVCVCVLFYRENLWRNYHFFSMAIESGNVFMSPFRCPYLEKVTDYFGTLKDVNCMYRNEEVGSTVQPGRQRSENLYSQICAISLSNRVNKKENAHLICSH